MPAVGRKAARPVRKPRAAVKTKMMHVRVDERLKEQATDTLAQIGLSLTDAVKLFLNRVVIEQALPLQLKVPNAETKAAMEEARRMTRARFSTSHELFDDLEEAAKH
jgi:DNA-damage-inducible protein J